MKYENMKCRAWIEADGKFFKESKMVGPEPISLMMNDRMTDFPGHWCHQFLTFMWFTGKKCKNKEGKMQEIYAGDIIEFYSNEWGNDNNIFVVTWDDDKAAWDFGGGRVFDMEFRTIIGNIYENPELIPNGVTT